MNIILWSSILQFLGHYNDIAAIVVRGFIIIRDLWNDCVWIRLTSKKICVCNLLCFLFAANKDQNDIDEFVNITHELRGPS